MPFTETALEQPGARNAVFLALVCRDIQPYLHYDQAFDGPRDRKVPRVLMLLRWDNKIGFPGGFVDPLDPNDPTGPSETLRQACVREALEETGLRVSEDQLVAVCSHVDDRGFATHLYAVELDVATFQAARLGVFQAEHCDAEVCGVHTPNIERAPGCGVEAYRNHSFSHNAGEQFDLLVERLGLLEAA